MKGGIIHISMPDEPLLEMDEFCSHGAAIEYARWLAGRDGHPVDPDCGAQIVRDEAGKFRAVDFVTLKGELVRHVDLPSWMAGA